MYLRKSRLDTDYDDVSVEEAVRGQITQLQLQQENVCEYLEKGGYTIDMFAGRDASLTNGKRFLMNTPMGKQYHIFEEIIGFSIDFQPPPMV